MYNIFFEHIRFFNDEFLYLINRLDENRKKDSDMNFFFINNENPF